VQLGYFSNVAPQPVTLPARGFPLQGPAVCPTTIGDSPDNSGLAAWPNRIRNDVQFRHKRGDGLRYGEWRYRRIRDAVVLFNYKQRRERLASPNQVLAIRFFDAAGTHYNTVSVDTWLWQSPTEAGGGAIFAASQYRSIGITLEWQDAANTFKTSILVTPRSGTVYVRCHRHWLGCARCDCYPSPAGQSLIGRSRALVLREPLPRCGISWHVTTSTIRAPRFRGWS